MRRCLWNHWFWVTAVGLPPLAASLELPELRAAPLSASNGETSKGASSLVPGPPADPQELPSVEGRGARAGGGVEGRGARRLAGGLLGNRVVPSPATFLEKLLRKIRRLATVTLSGRRARPGRPEVAGTPGPVLRPSDNIVEAEQGAEEMEEDGGDGVTSGLEEVDVEVEEDAAEAVEAEEGQTRRLGRGGWRRLEPQGGRSPLARGRALVLGGEEVLEEVVELLPLAEGRQVGPGRAGPDRDLLHLTNFLIVAVGVFVFLVLSSVLVGTVVCQHPAREETFPDDSSCSSFPSSLSEAAVSYHSSGLRGAEGAVCEDLYSLDNDYFLSSLEDISVQT